MAAKLREKDGFYWVVVHHQGRRKWKKIGKDKREAQKVVHRVNAELALGQFSMERNRGTATVGEALRRWRADYAPTFSVSYAQLTEINIRRHLEPAFGSLQLSEISERDVLQFIREKSAGGGACPSLKPATLLNILSMLGRVLALAVEEGEIERNPCRNLRKLLAKVDRQQSDEVGGIDSWTRDEVRKLLAVAREHESVFHPLLEFLLSTGVRKGEVLALKWQDLDFDGARVHVRRALVRGRMGTPKSGRARFVVLSPALLETLEDLLFQRRRECLERGWASVPELVFCSETGGPLDERNVNRTWDRLRRKAQKQGVRPLRLHDARHTFASLALASGKSVRWVAGQLGHSTAELTLRVYAHALREEETDLSFLDFGGTRRHPRGTKRRSAQPARTPRGATMRRVRERLARREGLEPPPLRFEA